MKFLTALLVALTLSAPASAQFQAADVVVGNAAAGYADHEFSADSSSVSWMDAFPPYRLWQAPMSRTSGNIGFNLAVRLDSNLVAFQQILQGTDWSCSQQGNWVFYTKRDAAGLRQTFKARVELGAAVVKQITFGDTTEKFNPLPSRDCADTDARILMLCKSAQTPLTSIWRQESDSLTEAPLPATQLSSSGSRWIDGSRALIYSDSIGGSGGGFDQEFRFDIDTRAVTQLTFSPVNKTDGFFFTAPEYNEELFFCTEGDTALGVYRKNLTGNYALINTLRFPSARNFVFSAEPFVFEGKTYLFAVVSDSGFMSAADIWIASVLPPVQPAEPFYRQVSAGDAALKRMDPEVYLTETDAVIYYFEWETFRLHRCETGLGSMSTASSPSEAPRPASRFSLSQNYPNPFNPETSISYTLIAVSEVRLKVFDVLGREVATLVNERQSAGQKNVRFNASNLPSGVYFYRITVLGSANSQDKFSETRKMTLIK